jgi:LDH2 family malate/lactate/ureidoglycolate dehydrogenase
MSTQTVVRNEPLKAFTQEVFERVGMPPKDAETQADVLVWANLRGVDSHGVLRVPWYVENVDKKIMNPRPNIRVLRETPAVVYYEGDLAFGPIPTVAAMERCIEKARTLGIGWALIRNITHQGAMAYYSLMAAKQGMAGVAIVCNPPNMAPHGARVAGVHNSPIAIAVPGKRHKPLCLDMATSIAARGKLDLAIDKGVSIPREWALDKEGNPCSDPKQAACITPAGGPKGSGLAIMFECLTSLMAGNPLLSPAHQGKPGSLTHRQNSVVAAIDIATFSDLETYRENADTLVEGLKALPPMAGVSEVMVPGEVEDRVYEERLKNGIPLPNGTVKNLQDVARRFGVKVPF